MKTIFKILLIYLALVVIGNISFWFLVGLEFEPIGNLYEKGLIIKIKPLGYAMVFAHGSYGNYSDIFRDDGIIQAHAMFYNGEVYITKDFLDRLKEEGYDKIWGSWCYTGNHEYMIKYSNGTEVEWYDWVSRNEKKGRTIPVFTGFNLIRLAWDK